jgi:hypothetical protein
MLRAITALVSSYLGEMNLDAFSLRQIMTAPQLLEANYDRLEYLEANFLI